LPRQLRTNRRLAGTHKSGERNDRCTLSSSHNGSLQGRNAEFKRLRICNFLPESG
jgi:hypothetical protein